MGSTLPPNAKRQRDNVRGNFVVVGMVISEFGIELDRAFAEAIREPAADILSEGICARASGNDIHLTDGASVPPRPVGIANDRGAGRSRFTRTVVPPDTPDCVSSKLVSERHRNYRVKGHRILACRCARSLKSLLRARIDR